MDEEQTGKIDTEDNNTLEPRIIIEVTKLISGIDASESKLEWVKQNIQSIHEGVKTGRHDTVYYPASGRDILRPLVAYDANKLILIDSDSTRVGEAQRQLQA